MKEDKVSLTVIMITLNEEFHIGNSIEALSDIAEEIFVVDSLSNDKTVDIALEKGAQVVQRPFKNFGDQWNFALTNLPIKTKWVLKLDPDERLSDELKISIREIINDENSLEAYKFKYRLWFMGKPMHVYGEVLRLWKNGLCKFTKVDVNEHSLIDGEIGFLNGLMEHHDSRDLHHWINKQNLYTSMEANRIFGNKNLAVKPNVLGNKLERRMFVKKIFFNIPFRYNLQFIYELFVRGAIKSGTIGIKWARLRIIVRRLIEEKAYEAKVLGRPIFIENNKVKREYHPLIIESELQRKIVK